LLPDRNTLDRELFLQRQSLGSSVKFTRSIASVRAERRDNDIDGVNICFVNANNLTRFGLLTAYLISEMSPQFYIQAYRRTNEHQIEIC